MFRGLTNRSFRISAQAGAALLLLTGTAAAEWWSFRGPGGNGVAELKSLPVRWDSKENIAWKTAIPGRGHSSPIVVGDRVFLSSSIEGEAIPGQKAVRHVLEGQTFVHPQTTAEDKKVTLKAIAVDKNNGRVMWERTVYEGPVFDGRHTFNTYASPTPLSDGKSVFFYFESQGLYAFDLSGKPLWKMSIGGLAKLGLAAGTSPVLAGGNIILQADDDNGENSHLYGVSTRNGEVVFKTKRKASVTYNTPVVVKHNGAEIVVAAATENVTAYDPKTGKELWQAPGIEGYAAASAVSGHGLVFPNAYHPVKKVLALHIDPAAKERVAWKFDKGTAYIPSPILYGDYLYLMAGNGALTCLEAKTGKLIYEGKRIPKPGRFTASPVAANGKLYLTSEDGDTYIIQAGPEHQVLGTNTLGEGVFASPALDGDSIFIRAAGNLYRIRTTG